AVGQAGDWHARVAFHGRFRAAVADGRVRMRYRTRHPAVEHRDREIGRPRNGAAVGADLLEAGDDLVGQEARVAFGLRVAAVRERTHDAAADAVVQVVGRFRAADVALAEHERRAHL